MTIDAAIHHLTRYDYERPVQIFPQIVRLRPAPHTRTRILSYALKVTPEKHFINWQQDPFGNYLARLVFPEKSDALQIQVDLVASMEAIDPFDFFLEEGSTTVPFSYDAEQGEELESYLKPVPGGAKFAAFCDWAQGRFRSTEGVADEDKQLRTIDFLVEINQEINRRVSYTVRMEPGVQTPEETLDLAYGSCRDSAWLLVATLRHLGLAARFVSGYLIQLKSDVENSDGPNGPAEDFTDLHAWAEVYLPGAGWVGLDATSGLFAGEGHIPLAATPAPSSAAPISGGVEPAKAELHFDMTLTRFRETPRVTKPLKDDQLAAIDRAGQRIDEMLDAGDVRLTVGGEPTFVASADRDAGEWNIDAVGPTKAGYGDRYIRRLQERFAPNGFLHHGQGKWYPGESLPRWAYGLYWRRDGKPIWENPDLIARVDGPRDAGAADAAAFCERLADILEIGADYVRPAYEDPAEFMLRERKLAPNLDPLDNKLDDPEERKRLSRVFERGLGEASAFVLPIQLAQAPATASKDQKELARRRRGRKWRSDAWETRRGRLFLMPGDSPAGFRLPLQSLAYIPKEMREEFHTLDPFAPRGPLPDRITPEFQKEAPRGRIPIDDPEEMAWLPTAENMAGFGDVSPGQVFTQTPAVRTALTVENRDGIVCVFLPPVETADAYLDLVYAVEDTAAELGQPVHLEGYPPPHDPRLNVIKVTPDPGVLEINIQPAGSWQEQKQIVETVYEEAERCGLEASKFLIDGRPTGSGGGAHVVLGGETPSDSPFLRRPDVLASLIRYWQNHPSLSYFFAGTFIGPTSQAPRVDEARLNSLYELEIALAEIPNPKSGGGQSAPPWLVDRVLRNLLVDVSGNTHRAEICIDKLYSPDSPTGRLGLLEFRGFEMPPHPGMNLAQQLLLRGLVAWFWEHPYERPFVRFGNALHDRYMLPAYLWADLRSVLAELSGGLGVELDPEWYRAQFDFRFPLYGEVTQAGLDLSLRGALEPWPVLGEEGAVGGTARYVDASVERIEVSVAGDFGDRYTVACNGYALPLRREGEEQTRRAGVRFRTHLPPSCLHPTIRPHTPLIFDIVDTWSNRAVGGCTYHAEHPGGRNTELLPVNALEAEGRRRARFFPFGHTPGEFTLYEPVPSAEFPMTLDLMRQRVRV